MRSFAIETVPKVVENDHLGKLLFAGGDDVIAFSSLEDIFNIVNTISNEFTKCLSNTLANFAKITGSCGITIAHAGQALQDVLNEARNAENYAKENLSRNAFAIATLKRSGENIITGTL